MMSFLTLKTETTDRQSRINERSSSGKQGSRIKEAELRGFTCNMTYSTSRMKCNALYHEGAPVARRRQSSHDQGNQGVGASLSPLLAFDLAAQHSVHIQHTWPSIARIQSNARESVR